jgi:hypothetical protein
MDIIGQDPGPQKARGANAEPAGTTTSGNTIFVQIAAYRDAECLPTIADLFQKAAAPGNISVGVCWQYLPGVDSVTLDVAAFQDRVRVLSVAADKSRGVCWARYQAEQFYADEDYILQIDSHTRFVSNWDALMCDQLARCGDSKAVLTCNPPPYQPPDCLEQNPRPIVKRAAPFNGRGDMRCVAEYLDVFPPNPVQSALISSGFIFARSTLLQEVATDPWLYVDQEEILYSLRLFTHGWHVYFPSQVLLYHQYVDASRQHALRPLHWKDCNDWPAYQRIGLARFNHLTEFSLSSDPDVLVDIEKYSLGAIRSLDDFREFTGIDFRAKTVSDHGLQMRFIPGIDGLRRSPIPTAPRPAPTQQTRDPSPAYRFTRVNWKLQVGDVVPFLSLAAVHDGKRRELHHFAGRPIVLFIVSNPSHPDVPRLPQVVAPLCAELGDSVWIICIIPPASTAHFQEKVGGGAWVDKDGAIAEGFGFSRAEGETALGGWAVLTSNLKLAALSPFGQLAEGIAKVRAALQLLSRDPGKGITTGHAPVLLVDDVLPPACCESLMHYWSTGKRYEGRVGGQQAYDPGSKIRTDCVLHGAARAEVDQWLARRLLPEIYKVFNIKITRREPYKLGMYEAAKGGFFRPHRDNFEPAMYYRRLAASINLNSGFEGGGVMFPEYSDDTYCPGPGCALVFPCALVHGVQRVTSGERFMIIGFLYSEQEHQMRKQRRDPTLTYDDRLLVEW